MPPYSIKNSPRAKHLRITIKPDGTITITKPTRVSIATAEHFIQRKSSWIIEKYNSLPKTQTLKHTKEEIKNLKIKAKIIAEEKVKQFNKYYKFTYNSISIKNQKTRWGSCSRKGNLNFNYKIAILPNHLADYLVVHELCHLGQFNHSQKFWDLVGEVLPNYKELKKELLTITL